MEFSLANEWYSSLQNSYKEWFKYSCSLQEKLPNEFLHLKVIDGDKDDLRFLDPKNVVVGLKAKGKARKDNSGFVIN